MVNAAYITAAHLSCDNQEIIYRARLSSTPVTTDTDLVDFLQEWVSSGSASVIVEQITLELDAMCPVKISSFNDPICPGPTTVKEEQDTTAAAPAQSNQVLLIAVLAVVAGAMACFMVIVCAVCIMRTKFWRRKNYKLRSVQ